MNASTRWPLVLSCAVAVLTTLDITVVNVALPSIGRDLGAELDGLQWVVNAYTLTFATLLLTCGSLVDLLGVRRVFIAGTGLFTIASIACGLAPNLLSLEISRAAQGAGAALVFPAALALIAVSYQDRARRTAIGIFSAAGGAAGGLGPLVGGAIVQGIDWRAMFLINIPIGALMLAVALLRLQESPRTAAVRTSLDLPGAVLAIAALFALNYALITGPRLGWLSPQILGSFAASAVLLAAFVRVEAGRHGAMLDLKLFRIPAFSGAMALSLLIRVASFGVWPFLILWMQGMLGYSPFDTGVRLLAMTLSILMVAPWAGRLQSRFGTFTVIAAGFATAAVGLLTMARVDAASDWTAVLPGLVLLGIGIGLSFPPLVSVAVEVVPPERAGMASGAVNTFFPLGNAMGVALMGAVFTSQVQATLSDARLSILGVAPAGADLVRTAVASGQFTRLSPPLPQRRAAIDLTHQAFAAGLAEILVVAALVCAASVAISLLLARAQAKQAAAREATATEPSTP